MEETFRKRKAGGSLWLPLVMASVIVFGAIYLLDKSWQASVKHSSQGESGDAMYSKNETSPKGVTNQSDPSETADRQRTVEPLGRQVAGVNAEANGVRKCITPDGSVSYSNGNAPGFCKGGKLEQVSGDTFNVVGAQPSSTYRASAGVSNTRTTLVNAPTYQYVVQSNRASNTTALCNQHKADLAHVRSRMRAGYKAYEYNRLMEKERSAKEGIAKYCK